MIQTKEKIKVMRAEDLPIQIGKEVQMKGMSIALFPPFKWRYSRC